PDRHPRRHPRGRRAVRLHFDRCGRDPARLLLRARAELAEVVGAVDPDRSPDPDAVRHLQRHSDDGHDRRLAECADRARPARGDRARLGVAGRGRSQAGAEPTFSSIQPLSTAKRKKWVYHFREGSAKMRDLLGGKGAGAAEMTRAGMPVPPGFTITTEACRAYLAGGGKFPPGLWDQATTALKTLERKTGKRFGDAKNPLLVSVRSGAKFSMPGMMDTVLNLGLNEDTTKGLTALTRDERFALDAQRRFIQMFGKTVKGIDGEKFEHALQEAKKKAGVKTDPELRPEHLRPL